MTVQGGFTSVAEQPCPDSQHQIQPALDSSSSRGPSATAATTTTTTTTSTTQQSDTSSSSTTAIAHADSHRQSHNPSKLPAFRFSDRSRSLGSVPLVNKGEPLSFSSNRYKRNKNQNLDSGNNNKEAPSIDYINYKPTASTIPTTIPTSAPTISSDSASAALPLQSSIEDSTVSPNPDPVSPAPGVVTSEPVDPGPLASPKDAVSGPATASNPDPVSAPVPPPSAAPLAATTYSDTSPPTTHHRDEKHAVSALTSAPTDPSTNTTPPTLISGKSSTQPTEPNAPEEATVPLPSQIHSRSTSLQPSSSSSVVHLSAGIKRPASFSDAHTPDAISPHHVSSSSKTRTRRPLVSRRSTAGASSTGPPLSLNSERLQAIEAIEAIEAAKEGQFTFRSTVESSPIESPSGQRELILPKTLSRTNSDERRASASQRPPVSYRPPLSTNSSTDSSPSTAVRVPPIRSFRSSGSRKSVTLDMNSRPRFHDSGDEDEDTNHDRTLRALEGRSDDEALRSAPISSRRGAFDNEDTGDVFLKIAREETSQRQTDEQPSDDNRSVVSRATRFTHRRPLSSVVPIHSPNSPPRVRRRLSDQRETSRSRSRGYEDDRATEVSRMSTYRTTPRDKAASAHPGEDLGRSRASTSTMRPSPVTPRSIVFQEPSSENSNYSRRRSSITDNSTGQGRSSTYKSIHHGHNKTYNSSPLVRSFDFQVPSNIDTGNGAEGTESTLSNTAPSTVWDELDDLKSRIHRLELTGKLPSTSGAAVSRLSDDRPPTATTTATTMSSSPKRVENGNRQTADAVSTTSSHHHRESHNILQSALAKSKVLLDTDIYQALESAANDAISLASMMGTAGQPGPISSSASTIGSNVTVTDRQLRRKAESVCRSLTELCLALGEEATQTRMPRQSIEVPPPVQNEAPITPTVNKTFSGFSQRRQSIGRPEKNVPKEAVTSPRTMSKFEERRLSILNGSSLPTSRASTSIPSTPIEPISSRRSSLLVSRARRAGTEEPDDGRTSSLLLRTRRAGTEEPDEGRRTSLFVRNRRNTVGEDSEDESKFRGPSRIRTDLNTIRVVPQEQTPQPAENTSAIPRRRYVSSTIGNSRLATPSVNTATPPRRYMERSTQQDQGTTAADRFAEERAQRYTSLGQTTMVNRTGSMIRRPNRESIASGNPSTAAGSYR